MGSPYLALLLGAAIIQCGLMLVKASFLLQLRGGIGPQPAQNDADYYSQFEVRVTLLSVLPPRISKQSL